MPRRMRCLPISKLFVVVAIFFVTVLFATQSSLRETVYRGYAFPRIWLKSWNQPWKHIPKNDALYSGTHDCGYDSVQSPISSSCLVHNGRQLSWFAPEQAKTCSHQTKPLIGFFDALGVQEHDCVDRLARFGPYVPSRAHSPRYTTSEPLSLIPTRDGVADTCGPEDWQRSDDEATAMPLTRLPPPPSGTRTAVVLRGWDGFTWTPDDVHNIRAMFAELGLASGGEYEVFILVHVHDTTRLVPLGNEGPDDVKLHFVPKALAGITELWTYDDCEKAYPAVGEWDVYYHMFMSLQLFAQKHPEFDYFWNWEMDVRYTGHYRQLFEGLSRWSKMQKRDGLWERNTRFYIPDFHGPYPEFEAAMSQLAKEHPEAATLVPAAASETDGTSEEADYISLFPMFDVSETLWPHKDYLVNYSADEKAKMQPRYGTVGTNARLSRKLVTAMHEENLAGRGMMTEMWPPTLALHRGLKVVYAPHPVFFDRKWTADQLQQTFNAGPQGEVGGSLETVINQEENFDGSTWFWDAHFGEELYTRWAGFASEGPGSPEWEKKHGMVCLPGMLLHPVKSSRFGER